jgi:hypothetical protein
VGKGTIVSDDGAGLYTVTLNLDKTHVTAELAKLAIAIIAYGALITAKEAEIMSLEAELAALDPFSKEYQEISRTINKKVKEKNVLILKKASSVVRQAYLNNNVPEDPEASAWCADKTGGLSGVVGIIEVPGERKTIVNIQPGYGGNAVYDHARDGQLQPSIAGLENNVFYNWALLSGWQKWWPAYRYGTITAIDGDTCDVTLEEATSSTGQDVNAVTELTNVPIDYMDVDGAAFENGDVVLIKFASVKADIKNAVNWTHATVIGFKDHPKAPEVEGMPFVYEAYDIDYTTLLGYVRANAALEPQSTGVLPPSPAPTFATKYAPEMTIEESTEVVDPGGVITNVAVSNQGLYYRTGDVLGVVKGGGAGGSVNVTDATAPGTALWEILSTGSGYSVDDIVPLTGGSGTGNPSIKVLSVDGAGAILTWTQVSDGYGYYREDTVTASYGGATFRNCVPYGNINSVSLASGGSGYTSGSGAALSGGYGENATANISVTYATYGLTQSLYLGTEIVETAYSTYYGYSYLQVNGEKLSCCDYGGYLDATHYIYTYSRNTYINSTWVSPSKLYLVINGVDTVLCDYFNDDFEFDESGYILPDYTEGAAVFVDGMDVYYILAIDWYNDDGQTWWEFFYKKNDEDLVRWTGPVSEDWEHEYDMPFGFQIGGVDAYCWDGGVGIIAS